jgi:hypothetical protein
MGVFFLFLLALCAGTLSTLFWIPEDDLGRGYFQMNTLVTLGLLGLALGVYGLHSFQPFGPGQERGEVALGLAFGAALLYWMAIWKQRWMPARGMAALSLAGCLGALLLAGRHLVPAASALPHRPLLLTAALLTSALLLGWSLVTMLLGHWYLVSPKLTFRHLVVYCRVLVAVVLLRCLAVGSALATAAGVDPAVQPNPWRLVVGFEGQGIFFWFRILWGLAIPLALAWMSLHCARRRSNQSATGILYVLVVGALIGEITALYLAVTTGVPV